MQKQKAISQFTIIPTGNFGKYTPAERKEGELYAYLTDGVKLALDLGSGSVKVSLHRKWC